VNGERLQRFLEQKVTSEVDYDACSGDVDNMGTSGGDHDRPGFLSGQLEQ
jgi:hypothetical protein